MGYRVALHPREYLGAEASVKIENGDVKSGKFVRRRWCRWRG